MLEDSKNDFGGSAGATHEHANKATLDKFGENVSGLPTYNGNDIDTTIAQRDVYDGLDSIDNTISLSASQGKVLDDKKIESDISLYASIAIVADDDKIIISDTSDAGAIKTTTKADLLADIGVSSSTLTAGEAISVADVLALSTTASTDLIKEESLSAVSGYKLGSDTTYTSLAEKFTISSEMTINKLRINTKDNGTSTDDILLSIWTESGGVIGSKILNSDATISASSITLDYADIDATTTGDVALPVGTYFLKIERAGAAHSSNYYWVRGSSSDNYSGQAYSINSLDVLSAYNYDLRFALIFTSYIGGEAIKADSATNNEVVGIAKTIPTSAGGYSDTHESGESGVEAPRQNIWYKQSITPSFDFNGGELSLKGLKVGTPTDNVHIDILENSILIESVELDKASFPAGSSYSDYTSADWVSVKFLSTLSQGVEYELVIHSNNASYNENTVTVVKSSANDYASGIDSISTDSGATWYTENSGNNDILFKVVAPFTGGLFEYFGQGEIASGFTGLTKGTKYYLASTVGNITATVNNFPVGTATSSTELLIMFKNASSDSKQVKASATDTTEGYLYDKISAGTGITVSKLFGDANEAVEISAVESGGGAFTTTTNVTSNSEGDYATDDFVFGASILDSNDSKFAFDKSKASFTSGSISGTNTIASGDYSIAVGNSGTSSKGAGSIAVGATASADGAFSQAFGIIAKVFKAYSSVFGYDIQEDASYAHSFGKSFKNNKEHSLTVGYGAGGGTLNPDGMVRLHADVDQDGTKKSAIEIAPCTVAPTNTTNLLYNLSGDLYWNGVKLN